MTELLYNGDAYLHSFSATVLSCVETKGGFEAVLDRTAFFPEQGGQSADTGKIGEAKVLDAKLRDGNVIHKIDRPLAVGKSYPCEVDFAARFAKMQCHTAEHIISGILHRDYGIENVGFHLGSVDVTIDTSAPVEGEMLARVERLANEAVWKNLTVTAEFPTKEELEKLTYRSKIEILGDVRIVTVPGYDVCACCAPHVHSTGEIGVIKFIFAEKHKEGTRIHMLAGVRAFDDYRMLNDEAAKISVSVNEARGTLAEAVAARMAALAASEAKVSSLVVGNSVSAAKNIQETTKNLVFYMEGGNADGMRAFADNALPKVGGILTVLIGDEDNYRFAMASKTVNLREHLREITAALNGRGGGKPDFAEGVFMTSLAEIEDYFADHIF